MTHARSPSANHADQPDPPPAGHDAVSGRSGPDRRAHVLGSYRKDISRVRFSPPPVDPSDLTPHLSATKDPASTEDAPDQSTLDPPEDTLRLDTPTLPDVRPASRKEPRIRKKITLSRSTIDALERLGGLTASGGKRSNLGPAIEALVALQCDVVPDGLSRLIGQLNAVCHALVRPTGGRFSKTERIALAEEIAGIAEALAGLGEANRCALT